MDFESLKVNFKKEVCPKTSNLQITMSWFAGVEKARSIDEMSTSQSVQGRIDFPDYEMLDATTASSLNKASQPAYSLPEKNKCRRATSSRIRQFLCRKTHCVHDL